jgi:membrane associated rhomboid family serine protease
MTTTQVGMRCPECSKQRTKVVRVRAGSMISVPRVTYALIAINVLAFFTEQGQFSIYGSSVHGKVFEEGVLYRYGVGVEHQYWRLVSSAFLHESILHIGFNMYLLYLLGMMLEPAIGSVRFAAIYTTALLAGSFGALLATASPSLGASGAIFGLMGAAAVELRARGVSVMQSGIGGLIIINLIFSVAVPDISIGAHVGGLIAGALAGLAIRTADRHSAKRGLIFGLGGCAVLCCVSVAGSLLAASASATGFA